MTWQEKNRNREFKNTLLDLFGLAGSCKRDYLHVYQQGKWIRVQWSGPHRLPHRWELFYWFIIAGKY